MVNRTKFIVPTNNIPSVWILIFVFIVIVNMGGNCQQEEQNRGSKTENIDFYYNYEEFGTNEIVRDNYIVDLEKGEDGLLFWANRRQILLYNKGLFSEVFNLSKYKRVKKIFYDSSGRLWVVFIHKPNDPIEEILIVLDTKNFTKIPLDKVIHSDLKILEETGISAIISDKNDVLYFKGIYEELFVLKNHKLISTKSKIHIKDNLILDLLDPNENNITISDIDDKFYISVKNYGHDEDINYLMNLKYEYKAQIKNKIKTERFDIDLVKRFDNEFKFILYDYNTMLIINFHKVSIINLENNTEIKLDEKVPEVFKNKEILSVEYNDKFIWIGTNKGLYKIQKQRRDFRPLLENTSNSVRSIIDIGNDSILIAHENGISLYNSAKRTVKTSKSNIVPYGLINNKNDIIFNSFSTELTESNIRSSDEWNLTLKNHSLNDLFVKNIYGLGDENLLVVQNGQLTLYNYKTKESQVLQNESCPLEDYYSIIKIDDELILTGDMGSCTVDLDKMTYSKNVDYPLLKIAHIYKPTDSIAWICTRGDGLLKKNLNTGTIDTFGIEEGLLSMNVHSSYIDSHQRLWASTDFGISVLDIKTNDIVTLTTNDGLHENEMNIHSFLALPDSSLIYGTVDGAIHFDPNEIDLSFTREELIIKSLAFTNQRTNKEEKINYLEFPDVITLETNYKDPRIEILTRFKNKSNNVRYLLTNSQTSDWQMLKSSYLDLSQVKKSETVLYLSYRVGLNEWSKPKIVKVIRKPPLYLRSSFYLPLISVFVILFLLRSYLSKRNIEKRNLEVEKLVNLQTVELSKKIIELSKSNNLNQKLFSIIGHDLKSPLTSLLNLNKSINYLIENKDHQSLNKLGSSIETNARNSLNVVNRLLDWAISLKKNNPVISVINIKSLFDIVIHDLSEQIDSKGIKVKYKIKKESWVSEQESVIIIIRNLVQNAVKYSYPDGEIILSSEVINNEKLSISIIDNGVGVENALLGVLMPREKTISTPGTNNEKGLGLGLTICLELSNRIRSQIFVSKNRNRGSIFSLLIDSSHSKQL